MLALSTIKAEDKYMQKFHLQLQMQQTNLLRFKYKNVHSRIIYQNQTLDIIQMSTDQKNGWKSCVLFIHQKTIQQ